MNTDVDDVPWNCVVHSHVLQPCLESLTLITSLSYFLCYCYQASSSTVYFQILLLNWLNYYQLFFKWLSFKLLLPFLNSHLNYQHSYHFLYSLSFLASHSLDQGSVFMLVRYILQVFLIGRKRILYLFSLRNNRVGLGYKILDCCFTSNLQYYYATVFCKSVFGLLIIPLTNLFFLFGYS